MPSFKLPRLIRRDATRPSLKQRMASLKATAGRVMRKPVRPDEGIDWTNPPEGFVAHPTAEPHGSCNIDLVLGLEAERLHGLALAEFERRAAFINEDGHPSMRAGTLDRLRRSLRLDELAAAAAPERAESAGDEHSQPGFVLYEDASGKAHRRPVAGWIAFTAARLHLQARSEMARQINDPSLTEEARTALALELRRDLRVDALDILAARPREAFDAAQELGDGAIPKVRDYSRGIVSPDLMRATAAHREACRLMSEDPDADDERFDAAHRRARALEAAAKAIPARSLADIRHKVLTLWPIDARDNVNDDDFAETLRCLREDVERLGETEIYGDKPMPLPEMPADAPAALADAYVWVIRHRAWLDSPSGPDDDAAMCVEMDKDNAIFARGIATPAATPRDLWCKAQLALEDFERFRIDEDADDGIRFVQATLRDVVALCNPARGFETETLAHG